MKAIALTNKGIEDICALEIKEILNITSKQHDSYVEFEAEEKEIIKLCYMGRTITKIILIVDVDSWIKGKTFAVTSENRDIIEAIADKINEGTVDLKNPDITVHAIDEAKYGIDMTGEDLSKRDYRVFLGPESLKGNIAYALLRITGYTGKEKLLDLNCRSGIIPIEAALYTQNKSVNHYDKDKFYFLKIKPDYLEYMEQLDKQIIDEIPSEIHCADAKIVNINAAKKNSKIAGIIKKIKYSRMDLKDVDLKYDKIDMIITMPETGTEKEVMKQAGIILTPNGKITLIARKGIDILKKEAVANKLNLTEERKVMQGKEEWSVLVFQR